MSTLVDPITAESEEGMENEETLKEDDSSEPSEPEAKSPPKEIIRYSLSTLLSLRSSKLSQAKPVCKNSELSCMAHHKLPPKMLLANIVPKFVLNQMQNRGEESVSPLSFHSNSSSSSNLSYQKRYQERDGDREGGGYGNNRYYYNKYNKYDDNGSGPSRIIYKTTAGANNGNNIRFLKKAYNSKYENQETSSGLISNKNILGDASRVITAADHRNSKKIIDPEIEGEKKVDKVEVEKSDDTNNNERKEPPKSDLKIPDDITNHLDDMFNDLNLLPDNLLPEETRESSKFSKWFKSSNEQLKEEKSVVPDLQNNNESCGAFPQSVESEKYFQPIDKVESNSFMDLLKGSATKEEHSLVQMQKSPGSGQVHSVEELEARLRHNKNEDNDHKALQNFFQQQFQPQPPPVINQNQEDVNAFRKLLSQIAGDEQKIPPHGQNVLQQMMNKSFPAQQQQQLEIMMQQQKGFPKKMVNPIGTPNPPHMIPPQQPQQPFSNNNIDMLKFLQQQQQQQPPQKIPIPSMHDIMKRPEVQSIVQDLSSGEISQYTLWQRLTTPGLSPIDREIITAALNIFNANSSANGGNSALFSKQIQPSIGAGNLFPQMKPTLSAPIPMPQGSPLSPVPPPLDQHLLFQHQAAAAAAANKLRLSPLPAAGMPQRIPSPRELQYHTQSIMQNALIRKKLEEQRENFRKRQEQEQKEQQQKQEIERKIPDMETPIAQSSDDIQKVSTNFDSPAKKAPGVPQLQRQHAPSPNMFTPTSVLRKMTAEKDGDGNKIGSDKKKAITGGNSQAQMLRNQQQQQQMQQPQQQQQFMGNLAQLDRMMQMQAQNDAFGKVNWDAQSALKPQGISGRPIVKANPPPQGQQQPNQMMAVQQQQNINFDFQQQQQQQQQIQKMNMQKQFLQQQQHQQMMQMKKENPVLAQFMAQQQQRAQQQQQQMLRNQQFPSQMNFQQQQMMQGRPKEHDEMENRSMVNNGGCLSPNTSNQLAKWFSPELLADASAGKLPSMKMNGQMLSLEEFEKCIQNS